MSSQLHKSNLDNAAPKTWGKVTIHAASLPHATIARATIKPGGRWSTDIKPHVGGDSCQTFHTGVVLSGRLAIRMDDGTEEEFGENDVFVVPPGHDAWCAGDVDVVFVEFAAK